MLSSRHPPPDEMVDHMKDQLSEFLVGSFTFFGFEFQNWMPIVVGMVVGYIVYLWKTGRLQDRSLDKGNY
jgi:hypothetical protein